MSTCVDARLGVVVNDYVYCASDVDVCWCQAGRGCEFDDGIILTETQDSVQARIPVDADFLQVSSTSEGIQLLS